jgi:hypothetical protein
VEEYHYNKLSEFIDEDGSFYLDYTEHGTLEVDCDDGECSVEIMIGDERYKGVASSPEELHRNLYSAIEKLTDGDKEEVDYFFESVIAHMDTSSENELEWDDEDEEE